MNKKSGGVATLLIAHVICCGGLLLFATGSLTLGSMVTWLGSGPVQTVGIAVLSVGGIVLLYRLTRRIPRRQAHHSTRK